MTGRLCCIRVVGVHMANSSWFKKTPWNNGGRHDSILFKGCRWQEPRGLNLDIDGWLRRIGLTQYAEMFRANDVDGECCAG